MNRRSPFPKLLSWSLFIFFLTFASTGLAQEVNKAQIPADHLVKSFKTLPWGAPVWDVPEAIARIKDKAANKKTLWVDTRPESFFKKGAVRDSVLLIYNKKGKAENTLTKESLTKALADIGTTPAEATVVFFCQGPKCHRSYNASFAAVTEWGFAPDRMVWFRDGYPNLLKKVKNDAKLKRKAKRYISDPGLKSL